MPKRQRLRIAFIALLGIPFLLWILLWLQESFSVRLIGWIGELVGRWVVIGWMFLGPLLATIVGIIMLRRQRIRPGLALSVIGGVMSIAFIILIGRPLLVTGAHVTPKNPSTRREFTPLTGLPVFPGAEGFGATTPAGRGGKIIEVTSLADRGPGTLRKALETSGPRIIVFRVGGYIDLETPLFLNHPFVTVAGQTAPGDGICIRQAGLVILSNDALIQHIRIRPGNEGKGNPENNDAIEILGRHSNVSGAYNIVIDHVSASWGEDETISLWFGAHDVTISWTLISEGLNQGRHPKGGHSAGLLIGDSSWHVSVHHSLMAHNEMRNPLIAKGGVHDIVNNVIYNWGILATEIQDYDSNSFLNFIGNTYIPGPSTRELYEIMIDKEPGTEKLYVYGNKGPRRGDPGEEWDVVKYGWNRNQTTPKRFRVDKPWPTPPITVSSAEEAYLRVMDQVGASSPRRDAIDQRIISEVKQRTGKIIDIPGDRGGYPIFSQGTPPNDSDHDGMPDDWEERQNLDMHDASDAVDDEDGDGYTNIEEFLHSLLNR